MLVQTDLAYTPPPGVDSEFATLDLYRLDDGVRRPLALLVHGGSWVGGDQTNFDGAAPALIVSVDGDPAVPGTSGYIVSETAAHFAEALSAQGHAVEILRDEAETYASLATGFGVEGDAATEAVGAVLDALH